MPRCRKPDDRRKQAGGHERAREQCPRKSLTRAAGVNRSRVTGCYLLQMVQAHRFFFQRACEPAGFGWRSWPMLTHIGTALKARDVEGFCCRSSCLSHTVLSEMLEVDRARSHCLSFRAASPGLDVSCRLGIFRHVFVQQWRETWPLGFVCS